MLADCFFQNVFSTYNYKPMPIISETDLGTNLYPEVVAEITRADNTITDRAIDAAVQEAAMYLSRFDLVQLFGNGTTLPTVSDEFLKVLVKDLACWHLVRLCNTGVDYAVFRTAYADAIETLEKIQQGKLQPQGWPYLDATGLTAAAGDAISWHSNRKRHNYF